MRQTLIYSDFNHIMEIFMFRDFGIAYIVLIDYFSSFSIIAHS